MLFLSFWTRTKLKSIAFILKTKLELLVLEKLRTTTVDWWTGYITHQSLTLKYTLHDMWPDLTNVESATSDKQVINAYTKTYYTYITAYKLFNNSTAVDFI